MRINPLLLAMVGLLSWALVRAETAPLSVEVKAPTVKTREFDPSNPPADLPKMDAGETARAECYFGIEFYVKVTGVRGAAPAKDVHEFRITSISATTTLETTVWIPEGANEWLKEHEDGHRQLGEHYYKDAEQVARKVSGPWMGRQISGRGGDREKACKSAIDAAIQQMTDEYLGAMRGPSQRAHEAFDRITDHGRNRRVTAAEGVKRAIKEAAKAE